MAPNKAVARFFSIFTMLTMLMIGACREATEVAFECPDDIGCVTIVKGDSIQIGVLQALTGEAKTLGGEQVRGMELAVDARQGKLLNRRITLNQEDSGCSSEGGSNAALKIVSNPQTVAVIGATCSTASASASKIVVQAGMAMISGNSSASYLTSIGGQRAPEWRKGFFRTAHNEENAGKAAALYAFEKLKARKAAAVNDGDIYTRGLTQGFEAQFQKLGGEMVLSTTVNKGDEDMAPFVDAVKYLQAEILFFPLFPPEGKRILMQARNTPGLENIILMGGGALIQSAFIRDVKAKGMYFVGPAKPQTKASLGLEQKYQAKYNRGPLTSYYLYAFDAAALLFHAIEKCAVTGPDGALHIGRQALRTTLYSTRNLGGVTGVLNCNEFGDCATPKFNLLRLDHPSKGLTALEANVVYTYSGSP